MLIFHSFRQNFILKNNSVPESFSCYKNFFSSLTVEQISCIFLDNFTYFSINMLLVLIRQKSLSEVFLISCSTLNLCFY